MKFFLNIEFGLTHFNNQKLHFFYKFNLSLKFVTQDLIVESRCELTQPPPLPPAPLFCGRTIQNCTWVFLKPDYLYYFTDRIGVL